MCVWTMRHERMGGNQRPRPEVPERDRRSTTMVQRREGGVIQTVVKSSGWSQNPVAKVMGFPAYATGVTYVQRLGSCDSLFTLATIEQKRQTVGLSVRSSHIVQ